MSSAASRPQKSASESNDAALNSAQTESTVESTANSESSLHQPPSRSLLGPPARPKPPARPAVMAAPSATPQGIAPVEAAPAVSQRPGPISLPSDPRQYRAIGLLKGRYIASEEQLNRGDIQTEEGTLIDAVLLGRVTSLLKKHIDLDKDHLWVVYPRTLYKDDLKGETQSSSDQQSSDKEVSDPSNSDPSNFDQTSPEQTSPEQTSPEQFAPEESDTARAQTETSESPEKIPALHVQIVGVWEPETLNAEAMEQPEESRPLSSKEAEALCDQFSVRGEVAKYSEELGEITINIVQKSKSANTKPKRPFKLLINGQLEGRTTGYFWDLTVERQAGKLVLKEGKAIGVVPPKKKPKGQKNAKRRPPSNKVKRSSGAPKPKPKPKTASMAAQDTQNQSAEKK